MKRIALAGIVGLFGCFLGCSGGHIGNPEGAITSGTPGATGNPGTGSTPGGGSNGGSNTGNPGNGNGNGNGTGTGSGGPGGVTVTPMPFEAVTALTSVRKVKNMLLGLPPTDAEVATVTASGAAGLQTLISTWITQSDFVANFRDKMVFFFRNAFQQTGFTPTEDFKPQLLENGGFDFGPLGTGAVGDDAFARLVQNLQDSFAMTAWQLVSEGRPLTEVVGTQRFMMTTGLKSLYLQIEMPNDQPFAFARGGNTTPLNWSVNMNAGVMIPIEDALNPSSANYMVFDDQPPAMTTSRFTIGTQCQGTNVVATYTGYAMLFQRLLGMTPRFPFSANPQCFEHAAKPYFTALDMSDWQWVNVRALKSGETRIQPFDLPTLRKATEIAVQLPRIGFYSTPAFLALWNTNDSNQHRVTANQTLLVALGQSFTSESTIVPLSTAGLDSTHAVNGSECYGCHKSLDPMRQFWGTQLDYNDRNDFPARASFTGAAANPRPATTGGGFAFGNVNLNGASMLDFGPLLLQVADLSDQNQPISRFAMAMTQKLCFFANSAPCVNSDPEFRRVASAFEASNFNFLSLIKELFSSPLVTGATATATAMQNGMNISILRRDQLCSALSNRLGKPDLCAQAVPLPSQAQTATAKIATAMPADAFSRGAESPVTPSDPTLFYRAASEMLCENIANQVVDATSGTVYQSSNAMPAIADMVQKIMGYPPGDTAHYAQALQILQAHYQAVLGQNRNTATTALRSTFALACQSPASLAAGL
jgi:hypothetical protein